MKVGISADVDDALEAMGIPAFRQVDLVGIQVIPLPMPV